MWGLWDIKIDFFTNIFRDELVNWELADLKKPIILIYSSNMLKETGQLFTNQ